MVKIPNKTQQPFFIATFGSSPSNRMFSFISEFPIFFLVSICITDSLDDSFVILEYITWTIIMSISKCYVMLSKFILSSESWSVVIVFGAIKLSFLFFTFPHTSLVKWLFSHRKIFSPNILVNFEFNNFLESFHLCSAMMNSSFVDTPSTF